MKTTIIMPTIRVPENLNAWVKLLDPETDEIIIAGNAISPHIEIISFLDEITERTLVSTTYLHPDDTRIIGYAINDFLPPNHTNRRNLALLHAISGSIQPDVIVTLDDDNYPARETWLDGVHALLNPDIPCHRPVLEAESGWWNAGNLCHPRVVHRGYPRTRWTEKSATKIVNRSLQDYPIGVVASLWLGDPDINAVERMVIDPEVFDVTGSAVLARGTWCPFDSQSTSIAGELAEMLFMWPTVGRYDDIWSSYVMRAVMDVTDWYITYGAPLVRQDRNPHNLIKDLRDEIHGYEFTERLTDYLRELVKDCTVELREQGAYAVFRWMMTKLIDVDLGYTIPRHTRESFTAWIADCDTIHAKQRTMKAL